MWCSQWLFTSGQIYYVMLTVAAYEWTDILCHAHSGCLRVDRYTMSCSQWLFTSGLLVYMTDSDSITYKAWGYVINNIHASCLSNYSNCCLFSFILHTNHHLWVWQLEDNIIPCMVIFTLPRVPLWRSFDAVYNASSLSHVSRHITWLMAKPLERSYVLESVI